MSRLLYCVGINLLLSIQQISTENIDSDEWPEYLCIRNNVTSLYADNGVVDLEEIMGGYEIETESHELSNDVPYWVKPPNDYNPNSTYIYYDAFYGYWQIGDALHVEANLVCMQSDGDYFPFDCDYWYDVESNMLNNNGFMYTSGCTASDVLRVSTEEKESRGRIIIIVLIILAVVAICVAIFFYYKYYQKNRGRGSFVATKVEVHDNIELGDEVDKVGLVNSNKKTGGMDMSPLNTEDPDGPLTTTKGNHHDEEDLTVDAQQNDIVDDGDDDEERLITAGNPNDEDDNDLRLPESDDEENATKGKKPISLMDD